MLAAAWAGCADGPATPPIALRPTLDPTYRPSGHMAAGDVAVRLFQWSWPDVAAECESELGPAGYRAALVSPPQEHTVVNGRPWWEHYQAVSYDLGQTTFGTRAEFEDMVRRCRAAGVDVYVDAVINHMTAGSGTGSAGTVYTKYEYPGWYTRSDFHPTCTVDDYQSAANVQDCELFGLADLNTGLASVREKIAGYLAGLARLGVAGFRIDAAKHIQPVELDSILGLANRSLAADGLPLPYSFGEVIDYGGEAVHASDYYGLAYGSGGAADLTEFKFRGVGDKFLGTDGQELADLDPGGPPGKQFSQAAWGLMPADKAVVFLENHDTQRSGGIWYLDGDAYRLANVWMLAQPYGYPIVMSSYAFDRASPASRDAGPPPGGGGAVPLTCAASLETATIGEWVCEHRDPAIAAMVRFRHVVAGAPIADWWDDGANAVAFSRGDLGFVAINLEDATVAVDVATRLTPGTYCDALTGGFEAGACVGRSVVVDSTGRVQLDLEARRAVALHAATRLPPSPGRAQGHPNPTRSP